MNHDLLGWMENPSIRGTFTVFKTTSLHSPT